MPMGTRRLAMDLVGRVCSVGVLASYHESVSDSQRSPALTSSTYLMAVGSCLACHACLPLLVLFGSFHRGIYILH